jgi:hypothetical protein
MSVIGNEELSEVRFSKNSEMVSVGQGQSSPDPLFVTAAEISSAPEPLRIVLEAVSDPMMSLEDILKSFSAAESASPGCLRSQLVPFSGMTIIFYVGQRLCRAASDPGANEADCIALIDTLVTKYGVDVNVLDGVMKQNVVFYASKCGSLQATQRLAALGADCALKDVHDQTALFYAAREGRSSVVEWLVKEYGCDVNHIDRNGQTALFYSARENQFSTVSLMVEALGADPLIRDIYKKRARGYLKPASHKATYDFLASIEKARDPTTAAHSHRKLFLVRPDEPRGAAAMRLRQHKPYNPYPDLEVEVSAPPPPPPKRQRSSVASSGATTPASTPSVPEKKPEKTTVSRNRSRFRVKAPLGKGGLESFENEFPSIALWVNTSAPPSTPASPPPTNKSVTRPHRPPPAVSAVPQWVSVVSQLLRGPLWRYGPAIIFHKPVLQLPANLGPKYQTVASDPELKLSIDLSLVRKKLEKGKYMRLTEVDNDVRAMFQQAHELIGNPEADLELLTRATEIYYDQQLAGCGLAAVIRQEAEEMARSARDEILHVPDEIVQ